MVDMDIRVTSVIQIFQRRLNSRPYVPSTTFGCATLAANGVASKLSHSCSATPTSASSFLRMWAYFQTVRCVVSAGHKCPGASTLIVRTVNDDGVRGLHLLPHALLPRQSGTVHGFGRVTSSLWRFCSSHTTSFAAFLLTLSNKNNSLAPQPSLIGPIYVERSC
jgi:hypothetical protein